MAGRRGMAEYGVKSLSKPRRGGGSGHYLNVRVILIADNGYPKGFSVSTLTARWSPAGQKSGVQRLAPEKVGCAAGVRSRANREGRMRTHVRGLSKSKTFVRNQTSSHDWTDGDALHRKNYDRDASLKCCSPFQSPAPRAGPRCTSPPFHCSPMPPPVVTLP